MNKFYGQYKNVLALSSDSSKFAPNKCSPHIFLDKKNNSMYIRFSKKTSTDTNDCNLSDINTYMKQGIFIKYVPIQRWVNIVIVCNADSFNTSLYAYVDGDLVNTIVDQQKEIKLDNISSSETGITSDLNNIDINVSGFLYVGADNTSDCNPGFSGLISNFTSFNYELNPKDIYNIYNKGPINGLLARLGLASYGVRSPIYKL